ncbi:MAG TPA: hypothetical protein VJN96_17705 [Vicinamibacterales bacterium]|nr:hypothetical protein [Vicinamibacterales bacterium]
MTLRRSSIGALLAVALFTWHPSAQVAKTATPFAALIDRLSEPGGDFGGDNLISNEQSYLHVMAALEGRGVMGGAYVGVGPDQNFSYIAQIKPAVVFLIDIRRDNLLLHLLFKALFAAAPTRAEYLSLLTGRPPPAQLPAWTGATIEKLVGYIDATRPSPEPALLSLRGRLEAEIRRTGVALSPADFATIEAFHRAFIDRGLSLVFQVRGQPVRDYYPSFRDLLLETDSRGRRLSYLASDAAFDVVRSLETRDLVVPVVGDVSGARALRAIGSEMRERGQTLSAFYISNVEFYLYRDGRFSAYVENLKTLPRDARSTMIRSVFPGGFPGRPPQNVPGYYSTSLVQPLGTMLSDLAAGKYYSYADLVYASSR